MGECIAIAGTLDTRSAEIAYVKELVESEGLGTLVIEGGILGQPPFEPDISHEQVAGAANTSLEQKLESEGKNWSSTLESCVQQWRPRLNGWSTKPARRFFQALPPEASPVASHTAGRVAAILVHGESQCQEGVILKKLS